MQSKEKWEYHYFSFSHNFGFSAVVCVLVPAFYSPVSSYCSSHNHLLCTALSTPSYDVLWALPRGDPFWLSFFCHSLHKSIQPQKSSFSSINNSLFCIFLQCENHSDFLLIGTIFEEDSQHRVFLTGLQDIIADIASMYQNITHEFVCLIPRT